MFQEIAGILKLVNHKELMCMQVCIPGQWPTKTVSVFRRKKHFNNFFRQFLISVTAKNKDFRNSVTCMQILTLYTNRGNASVCILFNEISV